MAAKPKPRAKGGKKVPLPERVLEGYIVTDTMSQKKWVVGAEIGSGGCGLVYLAAPDNSSGVLPNNWDYVIKVESYSSGGLFSEIHFYRNTGRPQDISKWMKAKKLQYLGMSACYGHGSYEYNGTTYRFLIFERYGQDLQNLLQESGNKFSLKTAYTVGISVLDILEYIHHSKYVHGDIKAANLLLGRKKGTENHIYLLDMGIATKYITERGHREEVPNKNRAHNGTIEFTSRDSHRGTPSTRRSDIESLGFCMLYWLSGNLPWLGLKDVVEVAKLKENYMKDIKKLMKTVFSSSAVPPGIAEYFSYVQKLGFQTAPNYDQLKDILLSGIKMQKEQYDGKLDFKVINDVSIKKPLSSQKENKGRKVAVSAPRKKRKQVVSPDTISEEPKKKRKL